MDSRTLLSVTEFSRLEPAIGGPAAIYRLIREGLIPTFRLGRRVFIDLPAWQAFRASGGKALPGGWRREPREVA